MLMELEVIPMGRGPSVSTEIAEVVSIIDESGMPYSVTAFSTLVEGAWDELMALAKKSHAAVRKHADRVILLIKLEDYAGRTGLMTETVEHLEKRLGRRVKHQLYASIRWRKAYELKGEGRQGKEVNMAFNFGRAVKDWWQADIRKPAFKAKATLEPGADFEGKLTILPGTPVRLNSHFKGEIAGEGTILVAERGEVEANIACKSILVLGKVAGSVRAIEGVEIKKRAVVLGNLTTPLLIVEPGGYFDGQCHMPTERGNKHAEETAADHSAAVTQPETAILHR